MNGLKQSIVFLFVSGLFLSPVYANDEVTSTNSDSSITANNSISPDNKRIRSILNSANSENQILSSIQSGNKASIIQHGAFNNSQIRQQGAGNHAHTEQHGADNKSKTFQSGKNNIADQYQSGIGNTVISIQHGNNNISRQIQQGNGINNRITQFGNNGRILIRQGF
ncbi:MAG: hypothetical protein OEY78_06820 [Gammaproteobacteria bacterium]|nr:hypothetical protein [Gammaproteobacteria bacterium]